MKMIFSIKNVLLFILAVFVAVTIHMGQYESTVQYGDAQGYYAYLPAIFIHQDLDFIASELQGENTKDYSGKQEGKFVNKYTLGVAVLQSPFFLVGHVLAKITGSKQDGYSGPYLGMIAIGIIFYVMIGLFLLSIVLSKYFNKITVSLLLIAIALATNLFYFTVYNNQMSHGYLFFLYALLIYSTDQWYENNQLKYAILIGFSLGMIILIRPIDILIVSVPIFYNITKWEDFKHRLGHFKINWKSLIVSVFVVLLCLLPQFWYWFEMTGEWIYYSYRSEGFDFKNPHILDGFTDGKNGWLRYTPIMFFALVGMIYLFKERRWLLSIMIFFPIYIYIVYSWHNWYYINSFGSRPMVGTYALLAIPLALCIAHGLKRKWSRLLIYVLLPFFVGLNIFQTYQQLWGVSWTEFASNAYYLKSFGKTNMDYQMLVTYDTNCSQPYNPTCYGVVLKDDIDNPNTKGLNKINHSSPYSVRIDESNAIYVAMHKSVKELGLKGGQYIKISAWCYAEQSVASWWDSAYMVAHMERDGNSRREIRMWIQNKILAGKSKFSLWSNHTKEWGQIHMYYRVPSNIKKDEFVKVFFRNVQPTGVLIDDIEIEICDW